MYIAGQNWKPYNYVLFGAKILQMSMQHLDPIHIYYLRDEKRHNQMVYIDLILG